MGPQIARRGSDTAVGTLRRDGMLVVLGAGAALLYGALLAAAPLPVIGLTGLAALLVLTFAFPVAQFTLLLAATAILPYTVQNSIALGGGSGAPGLVIADVLLLTGLLRAVYALLVSPRLSAGEWTAITLLIAYLGLTTAQSVHGIFFEGAAVSQAGDELRSLNGVAALLIALPLLRDPGSRGRLLKGLLVIGLALGVWGLTQWVLKLNFEGGFGLRTGTGGAATAAPAQLQGGLYGFPVAVVLTLSALLADDLRSAVARWLVIACLVLNGICLVLTYERTFLLITGLACALVVFRAGRGRRGKAVLLIALAVVLVCVPLALFSPATLTTARERFLQLGQYSQDQSVRDRVVESENVLDQVKLHPIAGSGLGAAVWWGRPENDVPPRLRYFSHNAFLWTAWKLGIPVAAFLFASLLLAALRPGRIRGSPLLAMLGVGAQSILLGLVVTCVTFPAVAARPITPTIGLLLAFCALPRAQEAASRPVRRARVSP